jgi:hypothetical protein
MERHDILGKLRQGHFPEGFTQRTSGVNEAIERLIESMTKREEAERLTCKAVRAEVVKILTMAESQHNTADQATP